MSDTVTTTESDGVTLVRLDDAKANALSPAVITAIDTALDHALDEEAAAVVIAGRPDRFSAGFDLSVMRSGDVGAMLRLVLSGAELALRLFTFPKPVVAACTGHALAMETITLLCADERIGTSGDYKIGLNEVAIGMALPGWAAELAATRIDVRQLQRATLGATIYAPDTAVDAGFLDRTTAAPDECVEAAVTAAQRLAGLDAAAFARTKELVRADAADRVRAAIAHDRLIADKFSSDARAQGDV